MPVAESKKAKVGYAAKSRPGEEEEQVSEAKQPPVLAKTGSNRRGVTVSSILNSVTGRPVEEGMRFKAFSGGARQDSVVKSLKESELPVAEPDSAGVGGDDAAFEANPTKSSPFGDYNQEDSSDDEDEGDAEEKEELIEMPDPVKAMFDQLDEDGSGELDKDEFVEGCRRLGLNFPEHDLKRIFIEADTDGGGTVDITEFEDMLMSLRHTRQAMINSNLWTGASNQLVETTVHDWEKQMKWINQRIEAARSNFGKNRAAKEKSRAAAQAKRDDARFRKRLKKLFAEIDTDGSGEIDMIELRIGLAKLELGLSEV